MDVHLLVYDLSQGLARQMSMGMLGFQLDAIYHTSIELDGLEYVYDGNVVAITPGSSHLGRPMQRLLLGKTELPREVIQPYLESLREIYTVQVSTVMTWSRGWWALADTGRHTTCGSITATTSRMTLQHSSWAREYRITSSTCPMRCCNRPWEGCSCPH